MKGIFCLLLIVLFFPLVGSSLAFTGGGCGEGDCRGCHVLTKPEAQKLFKDFGGNVLEVKMSEVPGLWSVHLEREGKKYPMYVDFSKQYLIQKVIKLATREDVSFISYVNLNPIDLSKIPLDDAIIIGDPKAARKVIVFDDPECTYCKKFHPEMKKVVEEHKDIAFWIKMYPLKMHPEAYEKAKAIICAKSSKMLEDSLAGKKIPAAACDTDQVDKNIKLAKELGIQSTPTQIFPDGRVFPGFRDSEAILKILNEKAND